MTQVLAQIGTSAITELFLHVYECSWMSMRRHLPGKSPTNDVSAFTVRHDGYADPLVERFIR